MAWSRVQPTGRGPVNQRGLDYYRALVAALRARGIVPVATAYHWDLPQGLEDEGGWANRDTAKRFAEYAEVLARALGDDVGMWITLNEPTRRPIRATASVRTPPARPTLSLAAAATHHLLLAHGLAVDASAAHWRHRSRSASRSTCTRSEPWDEDARRRRGRSTQSRTACSSTRFCTARTRHAARAEMLPPEDLIEPGDMARIAVPLDFLGLNYYCPHYVRLGDWDDLRRAKARCPDVRASSTTCRRRLPAPTWAG